MKGPVCSPNASDCFLAKVEDIYGTGSGKRLEAREVCGDTCEKTLSTAVMFAVLLQVAPRSHGWARWNKELPPAVSYEHLAVNGDDYTDVLRELISIAPRPRSYKRWIALLDLVGEEIGGTGKCVRCHKITPLADMIHRKSGQGISENAGLVCATCNDEIKVKGR